MSALGHRDERPTAGQVAPIGQFAYAGSLVLKGCRQTLSPSPTSSPLFFEGLKDADDGDDRGGSVWLRRRLVGSRQVLSPRPASCRLSVCAASMTGFRREWVAQKYHLRQCFSPQPRRW